jgi:hypothetical protein
MIGISKHVVALALLSLILSGCSQGPPVGEVTGKVTYKSKQISFARVEFQPVGEGKSSLGWTDENGEYTAMYTLSQEGALIGMHKVSLSLYPPEGQAAPPVPPEYSGKAGVEFEVKPGSNQFDISF